MKKIQTLNDILVYELKGLYDIEKKLSKYLSQYAKNVVSLPLKKALTSYLHNGDNRTNKLRWAFQYLNQKFAARANKPITTLLHEYRGLLNAIETDELRDAVLNVCVQRILHHNISTYGTCQTFAHELRLHNVEEILKEILVAEKETDLLLSNLAIKEINDNAYAVEIK